ncbi:ArsR/SmtB family transcription factor [Rathayibacter soli]|uniref:ArsR/SmtB family transcription factor n=1 Tax=Rathayibacter soli TaxID=3144168 RepID=UPI0027E4BDF7|nr:helix-turn-helix domain-containing protein [Glaciibacter superstes]
MASRTATDLTHPERDELRFVDVAAAVSDPMRLVIIARLADCGPSGELACSAFELPISKSTQSGHFRTLREAGVIRQRVEGTRKLNRLRRDDLDARFPGLLDLAIPQGRQAAIDWNIPAPDNFAAGTVR